MKYLLLLLFCTISNISMNQCSHSFNFISNDTIFQDYFELISSKNDKIIVIGSHIIRGTSNDSIYNAPTFQIFDLCGNILMKKIFHFVGSFLIRHDPAPTHNTYLEEPIGNRAIKINEFEFLVADKAIDTNLKKPYLLIFGISENGELQKYNQVELSFTELNQNVIKNVLKLNNGILIIMWDYGFNYVFYYLDDNYNLVNKKNINSGRGIRSIQQNLDGDFICSSLAYDKSSFQYYKMNQDGEINWIKTPYDKFGSIRDLKIIDDKLYITGGITNIGVFLICDLNGNILKELNFDTIYCNQRLCNSYIDNQNSFYISGYIQHCEKSDIRGSDVILMRIDTIGSIKWVETYNFKSALGTLGDGGYYTDFGGFMIDKTSEGEIITNGMTKYFPTQTAAVLHEDALLIETNSNIISSTSYNIPIPNTFRIIPNLSTDYLTLLGPIESIINWQVFNSNGELVMKGKRVNNKINIINIKAGMYYIVLIDNHGQRFKERFLKF